jgi:hypothetical protein
MALGFQMAEGSASLPQPDEIKIDTSCSQFRDGGFFL